MSNPELKSINRKIRDAADSLGDRFKPSQLATAVIPTLSPLEREMIFSIGLEKTIHAVLTACAADEKEEILAERGPS